MTAKGEAKKKNLLVLDYEGSLEEHLTLLAPYQTTFCKSTFEAVERCREEPFHGAIIDFDHPLARLESVQELRSLHPHMKILGIATITEVKEVVAAVKGGANDFLAKPCTNDEVQAFFDSLEDDAVSGRGFENSDDQVCIRDGRPIIGDSKPMQQIFRLIKMLAKVDTTVLVRGESGTGKELVAQALHNHSKRRQGPFVAVNCGAIPENLIESELFGFDKGAFTGAEKKRMGKFQFAHKGTIFLDEIGDVSPQMQVKLLRALQEKKVTPVGSHEEIPIDARVVSATNKNLEKMVEEGSFRADLYYRLNVMPISLPPLRDRSDDIAPLCDFLISKFNRLHGRNITAIAAEALHMLKSYSWPGNVRELENVMEHAFIIESSSTINQEALPQNLFQLSSSVSTPAEGARSNGSLLPNFDSLEKELKYPLLKEQFEREFIQTALRTYRGRINLTAEQTQMTKVTLLRKLEKYEINPRDYQH